MSASISPKLKFSTSKNTPLQFRATIINQQQIKDLPSIYKSRKESYNIVQMPIDLPQSSDIEQTLHEISQSKRFKQKIILIKHKKFKLKSLVNQIQQDHALPPGLQLQKQRKVFSLQKIIQQCRQRDQSQRYDENNINTNQQFKESVKNIFRIRTNQKNCYQNQTSATGNLCFSRSNFISLSNGKPQKQSNNIQFPKWIDYAEYKIKPIKNQVMNIDRIQKKLKKLVDKAVLYTKRTRRKTMQLQNTRKYSISDKISSKFISARNIVIEQDEQDDKITIQEPSKTSKTTNRQDKHKQRYQTIASLDNYNKHQQSCITAIKTIVKTQKSSQEMLKTMVSYFKSKLKKQSQFKNQILCLKGDRKLTFDIRRKIFNIVGLSKMKDLKQYRFESQKSRCQLKAQNQRFYLNLLNKMKIYNIQDLPLSGKIIQRLRTILTSHYLIDQIHYDMIIEPSLYEQEDPMSVYLINQIAKLIHK